MECQVGHDWEGDLGLMVEIKGETRYAADNPTLPSYIFPTQPLSSPLLPANPTAAHIRTFTDENNLLKRYWAMVRGFCRGVIENIHNTLYLDFFELLQHARYNYLKVLPQEYITNLETKHCPLNVNEIVELKAHYSRG